MLFLHVEPIAGSQLGRAVALEGAAAKCAAAASKGTALPQGEPLGADGYSGQQGGEAARPNRLCRLPSLLAAMGGRGILREDSHTSLSSHSRKQTRQGRSNQDPGECPVPGCSVSAAPIIEIYIYKSKLANLQIKMCIFASNKNEII